MVTRSDPSFQLPGPVEPATIKPGRLPEDGTSFSGHERDVLFLNLGNGQFKDISGVSGADDPGDGRVFVLLDFDRDGWWDIAEINANAPALKLYHNRFGSDARRRATHNVIALRFTGSNRDAKSATRRSTRDGFGALVTLDLGDTKLVREHRAGEGFAGQNSRTMLVGIGAHPLARTITVRWPSGKTQTLGRVRANRLVTVHEPSDDVPADVAVEETQYVTAGSLAWGKGPPTGSPPAGASGMSIDLPPGAGDPELRLFTTFATWCEACRADLPQFARLKEAFPADRLGLFGVPVDPKDERAKLEEWLATYKPPYTMLIDLPPEQPAAVKRLLMERLRRDALPSTIVTNRKGEILKAMLGVPTVSDLRMLGDGAAPAH